MASKRFERLTSRGASGRIMRVAVDFQNERLDIDVPDDRLIADWHGPSGVAPADVPGLVLKALEAPLDYPPLRQAIVPGDRVAIAHDGDVSCARALLATLFSLLEAAGVDRGAVTVVVPPGDHAELSRLVPEGAALVVHDPDDREQLRYLANTSEGRRIYLNRHLSDADLVIPAGRIGYDPILGYRGPWSAIYPGLGDRDTAGSLRERLTGEAPDRERPRPALIESSEVSWLLGCQFHLGLVAGVNGPAAVVAGLESAVRDRGALVLDAAWSFQAESAADLVVVGIGRPGMAAGFDDLAEGLATAVRLVRRGGKIAALSRVTGEIGPALGSLIGIDDPRLAPQAVRGHEAAPDYPAALLLANALAWADIYLLSGLASETVEDLSMIVLDRADEARRLVAASHSCLFASQAELIRGSVAS